MNTLTLRDVHVSIGGSHILQGVNFDVPAKKVTALLGRNGVGKTTTLKAIMALHRATGSIVLDGEELIGQETYKIAKRGIGEEIASAALITEIPGEIRGRKPPLWRVEFAQWNKPTLYFSPTTGELISRRHELWRIFDFVWMLHIMDYDERENVNNTLLRIFTWGAILMASSGIWLLFYSFHRKKKKSGSRT